MGAREKKCKWDIMTIKIAAYLDNLEMVKYCVANECPVDEWACASAASGGNLECLKYLHEEVKTPWDWSTADLAALNGHLHILEHLVERKYDQYSELVCAYAAENGHLDCLKYLREKPPKRLGTRTRFEKRTRTTESSVYNTSSTTTVLSHPVGDTKTECYTSQKTQKQRKKTECTRSV